MICRFEWRTMFVGAVLAVGAGTAPAQQDTVATGRAAQQPAVHVVGAGETLWGIARQYLGDPLLWPEIYRLNTDVIEDPHWIFVGEVLRLPAPPAPAPTPVPEAAPVEEAPEAAVREAPVAPPAPPPPAPPPAAAESPTVFMARPGPTPPPSPTVYGTPYAYRAVRRGEFYAAGFLTEGQELPWAEVLGAVGRPMLAHLRASSSQRILGEVEIRAPEGAEYRAGDSLLVAQIGREVAGWGQVVIPTGIVAVTRVSGRRVVGVVVEQFGRIADGQGALPLEPFRDPGAVVPVPVAHGLAGLVIARRDLTPIVGQQDIVFLDRGRDAGVVPGDVFEVVRQVGERQGGEPAWEQLAVMHIVHVRGRSASGLIMEIRGLGVEAGAPVRLLRKMPS